MSKPLNNNTNLYHNKLLQQQQTHRRKAELQIQRPSTRESDGQRLRQSTKENIYDPDVNSSVNKDFPNLTAVETLARKKKFASYKFYLDNLEPQVHKRIERGIRLLGATMEAFFSSKCTHLITTKSIPLQANLLQPPNHSCDTNVTKATNRKPYSDVVERALQMNISLWSSEVMLKTLSFFLEVSCGSKQTQEKKRALGKVLQEEKLFGPSTGANNEAQAKRPQFIPFKGHFLIVEDSTQIHRPMIQRQYTKEVFTKRQPDYPWPFLKTTQKTRSPFGNRTPQPPKEEDGDKENQPAKKSPEVPTPPVVGVGPTATNTITRDPKMCTPSPSQTNRGPLGPIGNADSQQFSFRASGFQPSCTATNNTTRSVSTAMSENRRLPPGESVNRLDKRMIENVAPSKNLHKQAVKAEQLQRDEKARRDREQRRKRKDLRFCENCNALFENLDEHIKEKTHQMYIKDQNNFKVLDELLEQTYRVYKSPLPDHMKNLIDTNIDGKNVKFASDLKRSHPTPPMDDTRPKKLTNSLMQQKQIIEPHIATTETTVKDDEGWGKYHDVFL